MLQLYTVTISASATAQLRDFYKLFMYAFKRFSTTRTTERDDIIHY